MSPTTIHYLSPSPSPSLPPSLPLSFSLSLSVQGGNPTTTCTRPHYENTVPLNTDKVFPLPASPVSSPSSPTEKTADAYTDVTGPLPGFLRSDDMLMVPTVTREVAAAAVQEEEKREEELIKALPGSPKKPGHCSLQTQSSPPANTYCDPLDVKVEASLVHEELKKKVSSGKGMEKTSLTPLRTVAPSSRDDYSDVSDALPAGSYERIEGRKSYPDEMRGRTTSDISPMLSMRSMETTKSAEAAATSSKANSEFMDLKTQSLHRRSPKKHREYHGNSPPRRKSHVAANKELVQFNPQKTGFKIAEQTMVEMNGKEREMNRNDGASRCLESKEFEVAGDVGGKHTYAMVDSTVKVLPQGHEMRKEGIGTPQHYSVPLTVATN